MKTWALLLGLMMATISPLHTASAANCSLCNPSVIANQKIFENDDVIVLYDYKPIIKGHCLVIPKRHVTHFHELNSQELVASHEAISALFSAAQKTYGATSYLLLQKNGKEAGQSVPHVHFHFFPRSAGDYSDIGLLARFYLNNFKSPSSQDVINHERQLISQALPPLLEQAG